MNLTNRWMLAVGVLVGWTCSATSACGTVIIDDFHPSNSRIATVPVAPRQPTAANGFSGSTGAWGDLRESAAMKTVAHLTGGFDRVASQLNGLTPRNGEISRTGPFTNNGHPADKLDSGLGRVHLPLLGDSQFASTQGPHLSILAPWVIDDMQSRPGKVPVSATGMGHSVAFSSFKGTDKLGQERTPGIQINAADSDLPGTVSFDEIAVITPEPATICLLLGAGVMLGLGHVFRRRKTA